MLFALHGWDILAAVGITLVIVFVIWCWTLANGSSHGY